MNNNTSYERSMFGLQDINADSVDTTNLVCDTLVINTSGTAPTVDFNDNSNNIATTAFVVEATHVLESSYTWSTGLHSGGVLSVVSGTEIGITAGTGTIITDQITREHTDVSWNFITHTVANISSSIVHFVMINTSGTVITQFTRPTEAEMRDYIYLGVAIALDKATITLVNQEQQFVSNPANSLQDLYQMLGFLNIDGNYVSASATGYMNKGSGSMGGFGLNYYNDDKSPNLLTLAPIDCETNPNLLQIRLYDGSNYDSSGLFPSTYWDIGNPTLAVMGNNKFSVARCYAFTSNTIKIQMGQTEYNSMILAKEQYLFSTYITEPSIISNGMLIAYIFYKKNCNFTLESEFTIINAGLFGATSSSSSGDNLQSVYNNSATQPQILIDSTGLELVIKGDSAVPNCLEIWDENDAVNIQFGRDGLITTALLPSCTIVPTTNDQLVNKLYADGLVDDLLPLDNTWTGINTYNKGIVMTNVLIGDGIESPAGTRVQNVNIGFGLGTVSQSSFNVIIGENSGLTQTFNGNVCIGSDCGKSQGGVAVAIGNNSAFESQGLSSIAIGNNCGYKQGTDCIAIGQRAGNQTSGQGNGSMCLGYYAGNSGAFANSIVMNASTSTLIKSVASGFYVSPLRSVIPATSNYKLMVYDFDTNEIVAHNDLDIEVTDITADNVITNTIKSTAIDSTVSLYDTTTTGNVSLFGGLTSGVINMGNSATSDINMTCFSLNSTHNINATYNMTVGNYLFSNQIRSDSVNTEGHLFPNINNAKIYLGENCTGQYIEIGGAAHLSKTRVNSLYLEIVNTLQVGVIQNSNATLPGTIYNNITTGTIYCGSALTTGGITLGGSSMTGDIFCSTKGNITLGNADESANINLVGDTEFNGLTIENNATKFLNPAVVCKQVALNSTGTEIDSKVATMYLFKFNVTGTNKQWNVDMNSQGKTMTFRKQESVSGFTCNGQLSGGVQVYFVAFQDKESNKTTSFVFPNNYMTLQMVCFNTNIWTCITRDPNV